MQGVTTIMSTHVLEIAQAVCDRVGIMYQGRLLALGNMDELRQMSKLPDSGLEDIFLKLTGTDDIRAVVEELVEMNWKNVLSLMRVDRKSGRLIRGRKLTRYRESGFFAYWAYWVAPSARHGSWLVGWNDLRFRFSG